MSLLEKILDLTLLGYKITFSYQSLNLLIRLTKEKESSIYKDEQWLPTEDHCTEDRINKCIDFMVDKIQKQPN